VRNQEVRLTRKAHQPKEECGEDGDVFHGSLPERKKIRRKFNARHARL
jgi:hypothetical protein